jgi:uncharacterized protein with NRDE domain
MCLIAFAWRSHPRWPLVMIANRDEFHARESLPADFLAGAPDVYGGVDLRAGGSWLLVSARRRLAAVTNVRVGLSADVAPRSRGELVRSFATSNATATKFIAGLASVAHEYGRFNLLLWDGVSLYCIGNHPQFHAQDIAPGVHALSNAELDSPWPKQGHASSALSDWVRMQRDTDDALPPDVDPLFVALADRTQAADAELPDTGVGLELERVLSPTFVAGETYGTRCSTLVLAGRDGFDVIERRFRANGVFEGERAARLPYRSSSQPLR